jgi:hypothetical protein
MFDRVRENLPLLRNFTFKHSAWGVYFEDFPGKPNKDALSGRYYTFDEGYWGAIWYKPVNERQSSFRFGTSYFTDDDMPGSPVGLYTRTEPADRQALERLVEETWKRREGR